MTTQEIKDLIASAIAGQGNQVDSGGKLAEILNEIVDVASQGGGESSILTLPNAFSLGSSTTYGDTYEQIAQALEITVEQVQNLFTGKYFAVKVTMTLPEQIGGGEASCFVPAVLSHNREGSIGCDYNFSSGAVTIDIQCTNDADGANMVLDIHVGAE